MSAKTNKQKKWSEDEMVALIEAVKPNYTVLFNNETSEKYKSELWVQATNKVNAMRADVIRTPDKVKEKWGYMKSDAKKAFTTYNIKKRMTGGGPTPPSPAAKYKLIRDIVPCEIFEGITGGCASGRSNPAKTLKREHSDSNSFCISTKKLKTEADVLDELAEDAEGGELVIIDYENKTKVTITPPPVTNNQQREIPSASQSNASASSESASTAFQSTSSATAILLEEQKNLNKKLDVTNHYMARIATALEANLGYLQALVEKP